MDRINQIILKTTLPRVFIGSENDEPIVSSEVWMREISFKRPENYLVEAESGTGKSSLCAYIFGNRRDYNGEIFFDSRNIRTFTIAEWCELRRRHIAYLPQEMRLFPELTALENVLIKNRLTNRYSEKDIKEMFEILELSHKINVVAGKLSVGQQQRVAIIRALCQPFDFILLDEPVSHLDERNNLIAARLISEVARINEGGIITTSVGNPLLLRDLDEISMIRSIKL